MSVGDNDDDDDDDDDDAVMIIRHTCAGAPHLGIVRLVRYCGVAQLALQTLLDVQVRIGLRVKLCSDIVILQ